MEFQKKYLSPTRYIDFGNQAIQDLTADFKHSTASTKEKAIELYLRVRDGWRYNPFRISLRPEDYRASVIAARPEGHCIDKAILYATGLRAIGIPSRLRFAKVKNHIAAEGLIAKLGTDELTPHGCTEVFLHGKWVKATPAFNKELCALCQVEPLEFDGENDSIFQEFNQHGGVFMQYLEDYGAFDDFPLEFVFQNWMEHYPAFAGNYGMGEVMELG